MKIKITESQFRTLSEVVKKNNKVECKCGHSWDLSDGGKDPYICHECGRDNEKKKDETAKYIKCRNCNKKFTQTIYKNKKSTPVCPTCGTVNKD